VQARAANRSRLRSSARARLRFSLCAFRAGRRQAFTVRGKIGRPAKRGADFAQGLWRPARSRQERGPSFRLYSTFQARLVKQTHRAQRRPIGLRPRGCAAVGVFGRHRRAMKRALPRSCLAQSVVEIDFEGAGDLAVAIEGCPVIACRWNSRLNSRSNGLRIQLFPDVQPSPLSPIPRMPILVGKQARPAFAANARR